MAPSSLSLFPSPPAAALRKTSLRKLKTDNIPNAAGEISMKGVAFQVLSSSKPPTVQPAHEAIKHSLFCDPLPADSAALSPDSFYTSSPESSTQGLLRRQSRTRRRSTPITATPATNTPATSYTVSPSMGEDELCPLPSNSFFVSGSPPRRTRSAQQKRPTLPMSIITQSPSRNGNVPITPVDEKVDNLSPLPDRTCFKPVVSTPHAAFLDSVRSASQASSRPDESPGYSSPMRSIFPQFDHTKPMSQQNYCPTSRATPPPAYMRDTVSKTSASAIERHMLKRNDSGVGLIDRYEHIPVAAHADLQALWRASCEEYPVAAQKVQFGLYQPFASGKSLAIGTSAQDLVYIMERDNSNNEPGKKNFAIQKHCPTAPSSTPVMQISLPEQTESKKNSKDTNERTFIFPQLAAVHAISAIMNSPQADCLAMYDLTAESMETARLTEDAITVAQSQYECALVKKTRARDSLGSVTATYDLHHPMLGHCAVTVTKSYTSGGALPVPRAKISLHHPSATPAAIAADTLNLAFLDFAHDACVIDIPALLSLDSHYVIDTVIGTLLAVALIENDALVADSIKFDPPPKTAVKPSKSQRRMSVSSAPPSTSSSKGLFKRSKSKKEDRKVKDDSGIDYEQVELPGLAKGALKVMEFGFKATAWVIIAGVKVGLKVGTGVVESVVKK